VLDQILDRLVNVKKSGTNKWTACCPVHEDGTPSMGVKDDGNLILMYCLGCGAKGPEIIRALGLPVGALFKDENGLPSDHVPRAILDKAEEAVFFIEIFKNEVRKGHQPTLAERRQNRKSTHLRRLLDEGTNQSRAVGNGMVFSKTRAIPDAFR
jgi:hypothetical protein